MKNLGRNQKPREGIPTPVLIIPQGVLFGREEYVEIILLIPMPRVSVWALDRFKQISEKPSFLSQTNPGLSQTVFLPELAQFLSSVRSLSSSVRKFHIQKFHLSYSQQILEYSVFLVEGENPQLGENLGSVRQKSQLGIFSVRKNCTNGNPDLFVTNSVLGDEAFLGC